MIWRFIAVGILTAALAWIAIAANHSDELDVEDQIKAIQEWEQKRKKG